MELALAAAAVLFVSSFTPGPNNAVCIALAASGGFWRALPWSLGVMSGFPVLMAFAGFGLGGLFITWPGLHWAVKTGARFFCCTWPEVARAKTAKTKARKRKQQRKLASIYRRSAGHLSNVDNRYCVSVHSCRRHFAAVSKHYNNRALMRVFASVWFMPKAINDLR